MNSRSKVKVKTPWGDVEGERVDVIEEVGICDGYAMKVGQDLVVIDEKCVLQITEENYFNEKGEVRKPN